MHHVRMFSVVTMLAVAAAAASASAQVTLSVDRLDGADPGAPPPAQRIVVDVFANVAPADAWTVAALRATASNGATLVYGTGNDLLNPDLTNRFVTCVSKPLARDVDARFVDAGAAIAGRYDPAGPTATATATEVNVAWFASPSPTTASPSVDGYIARVVIDISRVSGIEPGSIRVSQGLPPAGSVALLVSQPSEPEQ